MVRVAIVVVSICVAIGTGLAIAQEQLDSGASGTVQSIDTQARTVTLQDGKTYRLSERTDIGSLKEGSSLNLTCDTTGANCMLVTSGSQDNVGPESTTEPSAGSKNGADSNFSGVNSGGN